MREKHKIYFLISLITIFSIFYVNSKIINSLIMLVFYTNFIIVMIVFDTICLIDYIKIINAKNINNEK